MSKKIRLISFIMMIVFIIVMTMTGCGATSNTPTEDSTKPITMRFSWWGDDSRNQATLAAMDLYHKDNPNITIEGEVGAFAAYYQKLVTQLASKTAPDIVQVDYNWVGNLMLQSPKPFTNINDLTKIIDLSNYNLNPIKGYVSSGNYLIGVPAGINGQGFFYNTEFFKKYNITASNDWTWDKVLEVGTMVNKQDKSAHLLYFEKNGILWLVRDWVKQKYGVNMFKEDNTMVFNEQDLVDAFTYVKALVDTGTIAPFEETMPYDSVYSDQVPNWLNGKWGMSGLSASNLPPIIAASKFEIGTMRLMVKPDAKDSAIAIAPTQILSVYDNSPYKTEAAKFINWFLNDDQALAITKATRGVPVNSHAMKLLVDQNLVSKPVASMMSQSIAQPSGSADNAITLNPQISDITRQYIYKVGLKQLTPQQAASQAMSDYKKVLDSLKK